MKKLVLTSAAVFALAASPASARTFGGQRARPVPPGMQTRHDANTGKEVLVRTPKNLAQCNANARRLHGTIDPDGNSPQCRQAFPNG